MTGNPRSIFRVDEESDSVTVVLKDFHSLSYPEKSPLSNKYPDMYVEPVDRDTVRVSSAAQVDETDAPFRFHGGNAIYIETHLEERPLTNAEVEWCEDTYMYGGDNLPETVHEFTIPHPEDIRAAVQSNTLANTSVQFSAVITSDDKRNEVVQEIQERYVEDTIRSIKLDKFRGQQIDLMPEWDPDETQDGKDSDHLKDMARMRADGFSTSFQLITGLSHSRFVTARARVLDLHEPKLEPYKIPALGVIGLDDWNYCRQCGGVAPEEMFLYPERRARNGTMRVCDRCAELDSTRMFTEKAIEKAKDERARKYGGQRRLSGYNDEK